MKQLDKRLTKSIQVYETKPKDLRKLAKMILKNGWLKTTHGERIVLKNETT
jgi:hypothetical protein